MQKIGFLGCGNIAKAIFGGAVSSGVIKASQVICFDTLCDKMQEFAVKGATSLTSAKELSKKSDILFLTVKPQILPTVLEDIKTSINKNALIVSPVAGVKIEKIKNLLGFDAKVIRVMPNTPLMYSKGATALARGNGVSDTEFSFAEGLFAASGVTATVEEKDMDTVTGISGSSPAFFMSFLKSIIEAGVVAGLDEKTAECLVVGTMEGTAKMVRDSDQSIDELIKAVASPNGTTEAGLKKMAELAVDKATKEVIDAAIKRSVELSK